MLREGRGTVKYREDNQLRFPKNEKEVIEQMDYERISGEEFDEKGKPFLIGTAPMEPSTFEEALDEFLVALKDVLMERQGQHGSTSIDELGMYGVYWMTRLKVARMKAKFDPTTEKVIDGRSPRDDFLDLAGYGAIGWMMLMGLWGKPHTQRDKFIELDDSDLNEGNIY